MKKKEPSLVRSREPMNPILIVAIILVIVAVLTYIIPAGAFDRVADLETGYDILDVDSFHYIDQNPVGFLAFFTSLTVGMQSAASIIFFLFVVGGLFQIVEHTGALKAALAGLPVNPDRLDPDCEVRVTAGPEPILVEEAMDVTQGKLAIGFRTGGITMASDDYPALVVCNALYGGSANSKLFLNVREKLSLCYYASSMLDKVKGLMVVSSGVEFAQFDRAQEAILDQLEAVRRGDFTQEELTAAIRTVTGSLRGRQDSQGQMEDDRLTGVLFHAAAGEDGELIKAVEAVTADQVAGAAQKLKLDTIFRLTGKEG